MSHSCHATGCEIPVLPARFMCRRHWFQVPKALRDKIWSAYRPGQEDDRQPSRAYCEAAKAAVIAVAARERREPDTRLYDRLLARSA